MLILQMHPAPPWLDAAGGHGVVLALEPSSHHS